MYNENRYGCQVSEGGCLFYMKLLHALMQVGKRRDDVPMERLEYNRVRATIEEQCAKYLKYSDDVFKFEALPDRKSVV